MTLWQVLDIVTWTFTGFNILVIVHSIKHQRAMAARHDEVVDLAESALHEARVSNARYPMLAGFVDGLAARACVARQVLPLRPIDGCGHCPTCMARQMLAALEERGL